MQKIILVLLLLSPLAFAQVASDNFNRANTRLTTSTDWGVSGNTAANGSFGITSNQVETNGWSAVTPNADIWQGAGTFTNDQYSQITFVSSSATTRYIGVALRGTVGTTSGTRNYYYFVCSSTQCQAGKEVAGTNTVLSGGVWAHGLTAPFTMRAEIVGSTLTFLLNGSTPSGFSATYTDTSLTTGKPGIAMVTNTTATADDWSGGNMGGAPGPPTISPSAGTYYFLAQSVSIAGCTGTSYYTTDGSTPTTSSTAYTVPFNTVSSGSETVKAICNTVGGDSTVASNAYTISTPANQTPTTDDFSAYFHSELQWPAGSAGNGNNGEFQFPLDSYWTGGKWIATGVISGGIRPPTLNFLAPVGHQNCTGISGAPCVTSGAGTGVIMAANTAVSYSADQFSKVNVSAVNGNRAGVCVRCSTDGTTNSGYSVVTSTVAGSSVVFVDKTVAGTTTHLCSATGLTYADGIAVEARIAGSTLQPLINASAIPGCSATYTDTAITQGNPGLATYGGGGNNAGPYVYNWSGGDVGSTPVSNATPATNWSYGTYTASGASAANAYPWMLFMAYRGYYAGVITGGGNTGWGPMGDADPGEGTVIQQYQAPFGASGQYQKWTVTVDSFEPWMNNWFMPLMTERWTPGYVGPSGVSLGSDSPCHIDGVDAICNDEVALYPGVQPHNRLIEISAGATYDDKVNTHCTGTVGKIEFTCSPGMHITKVNPDATYPNTVLTVASSDITPLKGDQWYDEYTGGHVRVACKGVGFSTPWEAGHAYNKNDLIKDPSGNLQRVIVAGTSAGTIPATWGSTWGVTVGASHILKGEATTDGTVTWEYYLKPCPTSSTWSWVIDATDTNFISRQGFPGLWMGGAPPDAAFTPPAPVPYIKDWQAGTADSSTSMTVIGLAGADSQLNTPWYLN